MDSATITFKKKKKNLKDSYHHYIPRFILRYFARPKPTSPKKRKKLIISTNKVPNPSLIFFYNISTGFLEERSLSKAYGQVNLYRDKNNPNNVDHLEKKLASLEGGACNIMRQIHSGISDGTFSLSREELAKLRKFIFVMHYRNDAVSSKYFQEDNPCNAPLSDWISRYKELRHLKDAVDLWLAGLKYYLETPHLTIISAAKRLRERYGDHSFLDMLRRRLDPEIEEDYFAIDYESLANYFFLGVWEAADDSEFVLTGNTFGLWEGLIYGYPGAHRLYVVSPRIALVLRRTFLHQPHSNDPSVLQSRLAEIPIAPPTIKHANEKALLGIGEMDPIKAKELHDIYRYSKEASKDEFIFRMTKLSREQTYAVNEVVMINANLHPEGSITFLSPPTMLETLRTYMSSHSTLDGKRSLFQPLVRQLTEMDDPLSFVIPTEAFTPKDFKTNADKQLYSFLRYVVENGLSFPSSYNRAYLIFHMATDIANLNNPVSSAIYSVMDKGISRLIKVLDPALPTIFQFGVPSTPRTLVKTLPKEESKIFFALLGHQIDLSGIAAQSHDVLGTIIYEAAVIGMAYWLSSNRPDVLVDLLTPWVTILV
ncbi:hypothetical protein CPB84DRAFT_1783030 [Gymnopilus junonius]|uniref:DUF4238 domain-containing protein n=1 Tax=Gymnopilus junonius TaxID=109634 RepID=A0A9P5NJX2_GYMJU|nr:hypothetical protein CPB84DRAFT_1783030 [Gymnopilus junonius]